MRTEFNILDSVGVMSIQGRLDAESVEDFKKDFIVHLAELNRFVLDLRQMDAIDSTGLGGIVACMKNATEAGGDLKIAALSTKAKMVFEITRAYKIFDVYEDIDSAVESYRINRETVNTNQQ